MAENNLTSEKKRSIWGDVALAVGLIALAAIGIESLDAS